MKEVDEDVIRISDSQEIELLDNRVALRWAVSSTWKELEVLGSFLVGCFRKQCPW